MMRNLLSKRLCCWAIGLACCLSFAFPALAKPQPPAMLKEIFRDFSRLEENLSNENWKGASEGASHAKQSFLSMVPDIKKHSASESINQFVEVMGSFSQAVDARDLAKSLSYFPMVQAVFVRVLDIYEYQVPPLITGLEINIHEALENFKGTSYDAVAREMQELIVLLSQAESVLKRRGVSAKEIGNFKMLLINTKMAAAVSDPLQTKAGLDAIQSQFQPFRALY